MEKTFDLYEFYEDIKTEKISFFYCGPITQKVIEGLGPTLKLDLEIEDTDLNTTQSIFAVFIEQMQNIINYSAEKKSKEDEERDKELRVGVLVVGQEDKNTYVYCGNKIYSSDVERIKGKIDVLTNLNKEELKALYKEKRKMEPEDGSKGAGLGLIEMARKAGRPIEYTFKKIDEIYTFFTIKVTILGR